VGIPWTPISIASAATFCSGATPADPPPAEDAYRIAIAIAKQQGARSYELLASLSLAKLYQATGRPNDAYAVLAPRTRGLCAHGGNAGKSQRRRSCQRRSHNGPPGTGLRDDRPIQPGPPHAIECNTDQASTRDLNAPPCVATCGTCVSTEGPLRADAGPSSLSDLTTVAGSR
jgi:hypothetical protein